MAVSGFHPVRDAQVPSLRGWPGVADCHAGQLLLWRNGIWCRPRARRARYGGGRQAPVTKGEHQPGTTVSAFSADRRLRALGVLSIVRSGGARNIPLCTAAVGKDVDFGDLVVAGGNADQGEGLAGRRDQESGVP
jgi:hypothetical protein